MRAYNRRACELWGREPRLGDTDEKFCGAFRLYRPDGTALPHPATPMAEVLRTGAPARDREVVIERPDGTRVTVVVNIAPLHDGTGTRIVGAVNVFQDITERKRADERLRAQLQNVGALYRLADLVGRARTLDEIYEGAVEAIRLAARADRASILTFDERGVMRFRAWRGLSDGYRAAVEGHSPWAPDAKDPAAILVPDVRADAALSAFQDVFAGEGIRALAFIPLVHQGRLRTAAGPWRPGSRPTWSSRSIPTRCSASWPGRTASWPRQALPPAR